jgi:putative ATP-dependent endonuclease of OLD family
MRIRRVRIQGYRCLEDVEVLFDDVTTFVGPNGAGKSSILRALDWFFNGTASTLADDDIFSGLDDSNRRISVEVEFDDLTAPDREKLGKYAPESVNSVVVWRRWENGEAKTTGKARAFPPFEEIRRGESATEKRSRYNALRTAEPDLNLPTVTSAPAVEDALLTWERSNNDRLEEAEVPGTNFFGFAGQGVMSGLFDYVLVTADLRATEETQDTKSTVIGRILERAVDRTVADTELAELVTTLESQQNEINSRHFSEQLRIISDELTKAVGTFTTGRKVQVKTEDLQLKPQAAHFRVSILDHITETRIDRQGHGFQRALLISALRLLAERSPAGPGEGVICLAIEEPELFQHPQQAKAFASVLRKLAEESTRGIQVTYATHSPYFLEPRHFNQIRRVSRKPVDDTSMPLVEVHGTSEQAVITKLAGFVDASTISNQLDGVAVHRLQDCFFAQGVVLMEGDTDCSVIDGVANRTAPLYLSGIVAASVGGKNNLMLPWAILTLLGIPCYLVADGDVGCGGRMGRQGQQQAQITASENNHKAANRALLRLFALPESDWPPTAAGEPLAFFEDHLDATLDSDWPEWRVLHDSSVAASLGTPLKNSAIYLDTSEKATGTVALIVLEVIQKARDMADL